MGVSRGKGKQPGQQPLQQPPNHPPCPPQAADDGREGASAPQPVAGEVDLPTGLSAREAAAVEALLQQPTITRAATAVGVHERTLRRWMSMPAFRTALLDARRAAFGQAIGLTQFYAAVAVATLVKVMNDSAAPAHCRVSAAAVLLRFGREGLELDDLADRVEALERTVLPQLLPPSASESETPKGEQAEDTE